MSSRDKVIPLGFCVVGFIITDCINNQWQLRVHGDERVPPQHFLTYLYNNVFAHGTVTN